MGLIDLDIAGLIFNKREYMLIGEKVEEVNIILLKFEVIK